MKMMRKLLAILIIVALISSLTIFTYGCAKKEKKAMILIHGILGGAMFNADTDEAVWVFDYVEANEIYSMLSNPNDMINKLALDENGEPTHNLRMATMEDERGKYTMLSMFEPLYKSLSDKYSDEYDVIVWQYDWRLDNITTAAKLENFIESNGYEKVVFITHSMGGNVVSQFLANSEKNREKVELFIPFSTPFLGSADAYHFLVDGMFSNVKGMLNSIPMGGEERVDFRPFYNKPLPDLVNNVLRPLLKPLGANLPSIYMLSPFAMYGNDPVYLEGETPVMLDGTYISHSEAAAYFASLDIAKKADQTLKPGFALYEAYQAGHLVTIGGELKHISNTVNTHYICGSGVQTLKTVKIKADGSLAGIEQTTWGDGVVSVFSSSAGNPKTASNVYIMDGSSHVSVMTDAQCVNKALEIVADFVGR